jgi:hypothetical protein
MTNKVYRSAQGKMVDLGALQLRNESVRAVGNMGVNARGDIVDAKNRPIDSRNNQVAKQYSRQSTNVVDSRVPTSNTRKKPVAEAPKVDIPAPPEDFDDLFEKPTTTPVNATAPVPEGIAAAIARARQIKED